MPRNINVTIRQFIRAKGIILVMFGNSAMRVVSGR